MTHALAISGTRQRLKERVRTDGGDLADIVVTYPLLAIMLPGYVILTQLVKTWFYRRFGD